MSFDIGNLNEVLNRLDKLPENLAKSLVKKGFQEALKPMLSAAISNVPKDTGALSKAIRITPSKSKKGNIFANVRVGKNDLKNNKGDTFYASFIEAGWASGGVLHPGTHFMRRAFDATKGQVKDNAIEAIRAAIEDAAKS